MRIRFSTPCQSFKLTETLGQNQRGDVSRWVNSSGWQRVPEMCGRLLLNRCDVGKITRRLLIFVTGLQRTFNHRHRSISDARQAGPTLLNLKTNKAGCDEKKLYDPHRNTCVRTHRGGSYAANGNLSYAGDRYIGR